MGNHLNKVLKFIFGLIIGEYKILLFSWFSSCLQCLLFIQRRRSAQDELMMRELLKEGDLISVSVYPHCHVSLPLPNPSQNTSIPALYNLYMLLL